MLLLQPVLQFFDNSGLVLGGGFLYFYEPSTTTPKNTYTDSTKGTTNSNPITLDIAGRPTNSGTPIDIYLDGSYKLVVKDSTGATIRTIDPVTTLSQLITSRTTTGDITTSESDRDKLILVDASSANRTVTLQAAATAGDGFQMFIKKIDGSANTVTIDANSSELIDGATTVILKSQNDMLSIICDGTAWYSSINSSFVDLTASGDVNIAGDLTTNTLAVNSTATLTGLVTLGAALNEKQGADIASATTTDIGAATGNYVNITGTTTITGLGTIQAGTRRVVTFSGILTLTHNGTSLILPTGANITTAAGDTATFISLGSGNWKCVSYLRANGRGLVAAITSINTQVFTSNGTYTPTAGTAYAIVDILGGGGAGGGVTGAAGSVGAGGGGAGGHVRTLYTAAQLGATASVSIGAGGTAGTAGANAGNDGGNTTFTPTAGACTANGGKGGSGGTTSTSGQLIGGGAGGAASGTTSGTVIFNFAGQAGNKGFAAGSVTTAIGGNGGSTMFGQGGIAPFMNIIGNVGTGYGSGGSGSSTIGAAGSIAGPAGQPGVIIITEFVV